MNSQLPVPDSPRKSPPASETPEPAGVSLLRNALFCIVIAVAGSFFYALKAESSVFRAAALQLCLSGIAIGAALDAVKIRRRLSAVTDDGAQALRCEAIAIHSLFVAAPLLAVMVFTGLSMIGQIVEVTLPRSQQLVIGGAIGAVLAASLWTVFARSLRQQSNPDTTDDMSRLPERAAVAAALSESRLAALLTAGILMAATVFPPVEGWFAWGLSLWTIAVGIEHLLRLSLGWFRSPAADELFASPLDSLLREIFLSTTNPVGRAFDIAESRFGLSLRSSWTIRFFRRSVFPIAVCCLLTVWLSTCFVVIEPHQAGLEERFGVARRARLAPGLQVKLPWPFGTIHRYPAGIIQTMQIGFEEDEASISAADDQARKLLWTKAHDQEFSLVLGSETELVAVNAIVFYRIAEDTDGFLDHALFNANPTMALEALAYRVLMEQTRTATLADLLSRGRDQFVARVRDELSSYAATERLGLDIVDVALINLHPPVEVAGSYLDVINAELDSNRVITIAGGEAAREIHAAEQGSNGRVASARIDAARRVSTAGQESAEFVAVGRAFLAAPETYRLRLWFEALERVLSGRRLFVVDSELPDVIFDERAGTVDPALVPPHQHKTP